MADPGRADIVVVRGPRGVGKTSLVLGLRDLLAVRGTAMGGIACPGERGTDGRPSRIRVLDLGSGEERLLAARDLDLGGPSLGPAPEGALERAREPADGGLRPLSFSAETFSWAMAAFKEALASGASLLALDEIGSLELERGEGFSPLLDLVAGAAEKSSAYRPAFLLTVRDGLAEGLMDMLPRDRAALIALSAGNREGMPELLARWLGERRAAR